MPDWEAVGRAVAEAKAAAEEVLHRHDFGASCVVLNVAWSDGTGDWAAGSRADDGAPPMLADSLRESASEIEPNSEVV